MFRTVSEAPRQSRGGWSVQISNARWCRRRGSGARAGSTEGPLAIDDPLASEELTNQILEKLGLGQTLKESMKLKCVGTEGVLQPVCEFTAEDLAEDGYGEKEVVVAGMNPAGVIG
jgi:hypothetical protein